MGKKSKSLGSRVKAAREAEVEEEVLEHLIEENKQKLLENKDDSELFFIDKTGSSRKRRAAAVIKDQKEKGLHKMSVHEKLKIERIIRGGSTQVKRNRVEKKCEPDFDLWEDNSTAPHIAARTLPKHLDKAAPIVEKKLKKARTSTVLSVHPGQSYNPFPEAHQDVLGMALAVELERAAALEFLQAPICKGFSEQTQKVLVAEEGDVSSEEESNDGAASFTKKPRKRLTRADRNRQRRRKLGDLQTAVQTREKTVLADISRLPELQKSIEAEQEELKQRKEILQAWKESADTKPQALRKEDVLKAPSLEVPLTDELHGTLRLMKSKGCLAEAHMKKMILTGAANCKSSNKIRKAAKKKFRVISS